jgi:hypothetical protein
MLTEPKSVESGGKKIGGAHMPSFLREIKRPKVFQGALFVITE